VKRLIVAAVTFIMFYLFAGFIPWNWDPSTWDPVSRFYFILVGAAAAGLAATYPGLKDK
jgi:multisubunit Na+/H+ antiporter MnhB subunit